jgi:hypothetical protein
MVRTEKSITPMMLNYIIIGVNYLSFIYISFLEIYLEYNNKQHITLHPPPQEDAKL